MEMVISSLSNKEQFIHYYLQSLNSNGQAV